MLESDQVAEHIPGCNMAFRREVLETISGFDAQYRKAGDDVDVCWRLQQAGFWITFAPGAFVWHHRRQTPRAYLRQQAGYGEAEALLQLRHPDRFTGRGEGKWRGVLYGASLQGLRLGQNIIYRGTFATGLFQCLYQPGPAHWAMLPGTLEWHLAATLIALAALFWPPALLAALAMLVLSLTVAALQARQAVLHPRHDRLASRLLIMALCYAQPLVRSWRRYRTRLFAGCPPSPPTDSDQGRGCRLPPAGRYERAYWSEDGHERTELLGLFIAYLLEHRWGTVIDSGWSSWDVEVHPHPWTRLQVCTVQEEHGGRRRLIRAGYRLRPTPFLRAAATLGLVVCGVVACFQPLAAGLALAALALFLVSVWLRGMEQAGRVVEVFEGVARELGLFPCRTQQEEEG